MTKSIFAVLLGGSSLAAVYGQSFSGTVSDGTYTSVFVGASVGSHSNNSGSDRDMGIGPAESVTLNPGTITFDSLSYNAGSSSSPAIWMPISYTDPNTFQTVTYNTYLTLNPYAYTSSSAQALALTSGGANTLNFDLKSATFTAAPFQLTGTVMVDGPNQDLGPIPFSVSIPIQVHFPAFYGSIDVANYPSSIHLTQSPGFQTFASWSGNITLASGTIDGLPFSYTLGGFNNSFMHTGDATLTVVPEPSSYTFAASIFVFGFLGIRQYRKNCRRS